MPDAEIDHYDEDELESAYAVDHSGEPGGRAHEYAEDDEHDAEFEDSGAMPAQRGRRAEGRRSYAELAADHDHDEYAEDEYTADADYSADEGHPDGEFDTEGRYASDDRAPHGAPPRRTYRPGRGGFDPEIAERTARAKYAMRQRLVVIMLVAAVGTGLAAGIVLPVLWWVHGAIDLTLVGYLTYLRRQVRIEEAVRQRRLARLASGRGRPAYAPARPSRDRPSRPAPADLDDPESADEAAPEGFAPRPVTRLAPAPIHHPGATTVELDDEDPAFDELDEPTPISYRRAVGE